MHSIITLCTIIGYALSIAMAGALLGTIIAYGMGG